MSQAIVNLTLSIVTEQINAILGASPHWSYQQINAAPELRQKLATYVLRRLPVVYVTVESDAICSLETPGNCYSGDQHGQIHQLIHEGIDVLLGPPLAEGRHSVPGRSVPGRSVPDLSAPDLSAPDLSEARLSPSSWFG